MINEEDYEVLKSSFVESQRLFDKLNIVAMNVENLDFDESGLYQEDEEMCERHWLKLSSKIVDNISEGLGEYSIELLKNDLLEDTELIFKLTLDKEVSKIKVDYSEDDAIRIVQVS